ncbi:MAG: hypothetical protein JW881_14740 [Spirochaetales bacterium]|nr:hypothetical protein [Spirochaetales bacterium]
MIEKTAYSPETCSPKEVGQYAERAFVCITKENSEIFKQALLKRRETG